jgi:hypothetical protein
MLISASCPSCGNSLKAPSHLTGKRVKCLRCNEFFTLKKSAAADTVTAAPPAHKPAAGAGSAAREPVSGVVRAAFWLGALSVTLGVAAVVCSLFVAAADYSRALAWLGIVLGGSAVAMAIIREECGFTFPFAGATASVLALALVAFWLNAPRRPGDGMAGGFPGGPGGMGKGPPGAFFKGGPPGGWKGGPPVDAKGGPPPGAPGGPPGDRGKDAPPPPDPPQ